MYLQKVGLGGGCHWCTEGIFQSIRGVKKVDQGWISSSGEQKYESEAVVAYYDSTIISLEDLVTIHLETHSSSSDHSMRNKYRSAVYYFDPSDKNKIDKILQLYAQQTGKIVVTKVLPFKSFRRNSEKYIDYYRKNPEAAFCKRYISPKLQKLRMNYSGLVKI